MLFSNKRRRDVHLAKNLLNRNQLILKHSLSSRQNREKRWTGITARRFLLLLASSRQEFHRRHTVRHSLTSFAVVIMDIISDRIAELIILTKMIQIVHLRFQNSPKAFHRRIIQTFAWTRHALADSSFFHSLSKGVAGILSSPVTMNHRAGVRIPLERLVKGFENQRDIILLPQ